MGGARASRLHLLGECLGSKQELPQSLWPGALLGAGLVVPHSQPAAFIKELITLPPTCVRLLVLQPHTWHAASILCLWQHLHRAGASEVDPGGLSVLGGGPGAQRALHSQKQVFSGSGPVDLRGGQSPASPPAPPGAAGAPPPPEQGDPGLCPPWPTRCCPCLQR